MTSVTIGESVTEIYHSMFYGCSKLKTISIPSNVKNIGSFVFNNCVALEKAVIGNNVMTIGGYAFNGCTALKDLYFKSNPSIGSSAIPSGAACHLTLDDGDAADFNTANANTYDSASYTRTMSEGRYGTIVLPFAPSAASLENYAFYALAESGDGYMRFQKVAAPVPNTPYLCTLRPGKENIAITAGTTKISATTETPVVDGWETIASFTNHTVYCTTGNIYALSAANNEINRITNSLAVLPYRAYFKSTTAAQRAIRIEEIVPEDIEGFGTFFDLCGRPVSTPVKGNIYIKQGKKIVF